ncbi:uncharacterized protein HKW66_Vig0198630 [Vigna angularis]|uniref:Uncharacterized protein n=1 Tax=Phaseolus angularis TaxID=3914 RepID=A0A8T0KNQ6_PHAAN|nr:uncharacterized protein HKW66_Vig0198630 [Vigna angularis]
MNDQMEENVRFNGGKDDNFREKEEKRVQKVELVILPQSVVTESPPDQQNQPPPPPPPPQNQELAEEQNEGKIKRLS